MDHQSQSDRKRDLAPAAILAILISYGIALCIGWPQSGTQQIVAQQLEHVASHPETGAAIEIAAPPIWTVLPFVLLLGGIAVLPIMPHTSHWWESNLNR